MIVSEPRAARRHRRSNEPEERVNALRPPDAHEVGAGELRAGRAHIEARHIGTATPLDADQTRRTAGVDAETQARFYTLLRDLNRDLGVALIFVSHDIGPLREMLDTVACVDRTVCYYGPPEGFSHAPAHFAVASADHHEH